MYKNRNILATVCARGGSKGVKNKNIRLLNGKPLILYSLEIIKKSRYVDEYVISTDSDEILNIASQHSYRIDFKRPDELAGDKVSRIEPVRHAVEWIQKKRGIQYDVVIDLGVATPLKNEIDLDNVLETLIDSDCSNVFSVTPSSRNPYYNMVEETDGHISKVKQLAKITDRRDAPSVYDMNDGFNAWKNEILFSENYQFNEKTKIYIMPRERSVDIDEEIDFSIAECFLNILKQ